MGTKVTRGVIEPFKEEDKTGKSTPGNDNLSELFSKNSGYKPKINIDIINSEVDKDISQCNLPVEGNDVKVDINLIESLQKQKKKISNESILSKKELEEKETKLEEVLSDKKEDLDNKSMRNKNKENELSLYKITIPTKEGFWTNDFPKETLVKEVTGKFSEENKGIFIEDAMTWTCGKKELNPDQRLEDIFQDTQEIQLNYNKKQLVSGETEAGTGKRYASCSFDSMVAKPFPGPFMIYVFIKQLGQIKPINFSFNEINNAGLNEFDSVNASSSAYCNGNSMLFIGGNTGKFWEIELKYMKILGPFEIPCVMNHSMLYVTEGKKVFFVGGEETRCFYVDTLF